jgi:hypothetical protein
VPDDVEKSNRKDHQNDTNIEPPDIYDVLNYHSDNVRYTPYVILCNNA